MSKKTKTPTDASSAYSEAAKAHFAYGVTAKKISGNGAVSGTISWMYARTKSLSNAAPTRRKIAIWKRYFPEIQTTETATVKVRCPEAFF